MKAEPTYLLKSLSNKDVTFFIPPYQRNYEWSTDICQVLLEDVQRVAESNRAGEESEHFFGSIVFVVESAGFSNPAKYVLTDGQQRITTTMLLLMALRDSIQDPVAQEVIQGRFLQNNSPGVDTEYKIKLKQVETDWAAYKALALRADVDAEMKKSAVYRNYKFFLDKIRKLPEDQRHSLLEDGLDKLSIIAVELEPNRNPWENPQEIFESMNSLGKPLSLADLVRNFLLMGKTAEEQTSLYNRYWMKLEKKLHGRLSDFIRDWMQADQHRSYKVASEANYKELYGEFKSIVGGRTTQELFEDFVRFSGPYASAIGLEKTGVDRLDVVLEDINVIDTRPLYSFLAEILLARQRGELTNKETTELLVALRSYLLRRRIIRLTQAENKLFPTLGLNLKELTSAADPAIALFDLLSDSEYNTRLPNDVEVATQLMSMNFYNLGRSANYPKLLLSLVEEHLTKSRPIWSDKNLQLEHVMPQTLSPQWRKELGPNAESIHQEWVNNIGNMTLIRHNQELGNKSFAEKKRRYTTNAGLQVAQNKILDTATWDEHAMSRRRDYLVKLLVDTILAVPDDRRGRSNWRQKKEKGFSSKQVLSSLIGETIHYVDDETLTAKVVSDSQVEFEGRKWHLSPLVAELKKRDGTISESAAYQGAQYWEWDGIRLRDLG